MRDNPPVGLDVSESVEETASTIIERSETVSNEKNLDRKLKEIA